MTELVELQRWYDSQCDGDWEHEFGVRIATLDNPGWSVEIDLQETGLESRPFVRVDQRISDSDWLLCRVADGKFQGDGDPQKLATILRAFLDWAA